MAYQAIVARIKTRPHPNADRLQLGTVCGNQVVVGLDTQDGELGVFFPCDGQLSEAFCELNDLYSESARVKLGLPVEAEHKYGFFSDKRRVRAQSFRGAKSDGFWCPLSYFTPGEQAELTTEGFAFDTLLGVVICQKYITKATRVAGAGKVGRKQRENKCFPKHDVTRQFRFVGQAIPGDAIIYITEKLHGTSGRYGHVLDDLELGWWKRAVNRVVPIWPEREYRYLNGSKNVILEKTTGAGWYGTNEFRYSAIEGVTLHKGEILYFEIVGSFIGADGTPKHIMEPHEIKDEVKSLRKVYGDTLMHYRYGTTDGKCDIYVYKIARINEDGQAIDLSWAQVKARCGELGLKHVPELKGAFTKDSLGDHRELDGIVDGLMDGPSTLDATHIREGVVLRVEHPTGTDYVKSKSWWFGVLEGYLKDSEDFVDEEESS